MTNAKLFDVFCFYRKHLDERFSQLEPKRMDIFEPLHDGNLATMYAHLKWACEEGKRFVEKRHFDKAFRWLGWIQGVLFARGHFTVAELGEHSRPPEPPYTTQYVSEALHSLELQGGALLDERRKVRAGCSHRTIEGQSALVESGCAAQHTVCAVCGIVYDSAPTR